MKIPTPSFPEDVPHLDLETDRVAKVSLRQYNLAQISMIKTHQRLMNLNSFNDAVISWIDSGYAVKFRKKYIVNG